MSCWVVPSIAADMWGCTIEQVLEAIRCGQVLTREEGGWLFVDVAPTSHRASTPKCEPHPPTYTVVTKEEANALLEGDDSDELAIEDDPDAPMGDWRAVREHTSRLRRPPRTGVAVTQS